MSETIDSLLVSLGLETDAKSFQKANDAIKGVKDGVLQLAAAAGVGFGFKALTSDLAKSTLEMDRLSKITGFTLKQIDGLRYAMRRSGLNPDSANALVQKIPAWKQAATQGELGDKAYWNGNFNPSEMIGKSNNEILEYLAESYGKMNNDQRRTLRSGLGLGENDDITRFLEGGIKNIKEAASEFEKLYRPIDQSLIESANKFNKEMATLSTSFESLQRQIGGPLLSSVNEFLSRISEFTKENQNEINTGTQMAINGDWYDWLMDDASKRGIDFRNKLRDWGVINSQKETFIPSVDMNKYQPQQHAQSSIKSNSSGNEHALFDRLERERGLPAGLLNSTYQKESGGGKYLLSPKGAMGPFQFMPDTANDMGLKGDDVYDLEKSATAAANYYRQLLDRYNGDVPKAVAAYNHGMGNIDKKGLSNLPKETRDYVPGVLGGLDNGEDLLADYHHRSNQVPTMQGSSNNGSAPVTVNQNNNVTIHAGGADAGEVENRLASAFTSYSQQARDLMDTEHY